MVFSWKAVSGRFLYHGDCLLDDILEDLNQHALFAVVEIHFIDDVAVDTCGSGKGILNGLYPMYLRNRITVNYSAFTAEWCIANKNAAPYNDVAAYTTYGTDRANAYRILEDSLNLRDVRDRKSVV